MKKPESQLTRGEKFRKRGLPATIAVGALAAVGVGDLVGQTITNDLNHAKSVAVSAKLGKEQTKFMELLDKTALEHANPAEVVPGSAIVNPGNHLYDDALAFAEAHHLNHNEDGVDTLLQTAAAISRANYIEPGSTFVLSQEDVGNKGIKEVVVQLEPEDETK